MKRKPENISEKPEKEDKLLGFFGDQFHKNVFVICLMVAVVLIMASFVTPPMWIIDGSVLAAVGELFAFAALAEVAEAVAKGHTATISHGGTSIEIRKEEEEEEGEPDEE